MRIRGAAGPAASTWPGILVGPMHPPDPERPLPAIPTRIKFFRESERGFRFSGHGDGLRSTRQELEIVLVASSKNRETSTSGDIALEQPRTGSGAPEAGRGLEQAIGQRIRAIRRDLDLTVSDLASAAGISTGMLSKIENGQISPSLATLQAIAAALNVPLISALFAAFEERRDCSFVPAGQGVRHRTPRHQGRPPLPAARPRARRRRRRSSPI